LRDYFYDKDMQGIIWWNMLQRYRPLVKRCAKREDLDDAMGQMASELSALHVFTMGGDKNDPLHGGKTRKKLEEPASLGATVERWHEWKGYKITSIAERDPDYNMLDGSAIYSPLSDRTLRLTGQRGLQPGDVIVSVNGESVLRVPDLHMLLRGMAGRSVRLDVVRLASALNDPNDEWAHSGQKPESVIVVPISQKDASNLRYAAWEYQTRTMAKRLADEAGFSVGYVHLRSMSGASAIDSFFRGFYPDHDKVGLIVDVRHNIGGSIDSWVLDILQRKAWEFWKSRNMNMDTGIGWNERFAFLGHLVILTDEKTSSDAEGLARGVSELGLGQIVGRRTWGGGIWLSFNNPLVDGGVVSAPQMGTYNDHYGWGLGIEQMGVTPHVDVDNDPRVFYSGRDMQLERAIQVLSDWLRDEPIAFPNDPGKPKDMSLKKDLDSCPVPVPVPPVR